MRQRKLKNIDINCFTDDIKTSDLITSLRSDLQDAVQQYNCVLSGHLDTHAPVKEKTVKIDHKAPWFHDDIYSAREKRRRLERRWRKDQLGIHRQLYRDQHQLVVHLIKDAKKTYYNNLVDQQKSDSKHLFKVSKQLMHLDKDLPFPKSSSTKDLAENFNNFFISKIEIRNGFSDTETDAITHNTGDSKVLSNLRPCTTEEIKKIVSKSPSKSCSLDSIPTDLLKQCSDTLLPVIKDIINISIGQGTVPDLFKVAYVRPLLKKLI